MKNLHFLNLLLVLIACTASSAKLLGGAIVIQGEVSESCYSFEAVSAYQRGSQVYVQVTDVRLDGGCLSVPGFRLVVIDYDLPWIAVKPTRQDPEPEDRILYEGPDKVADYEVDKKSPWVESHAFNFREINVAEFPWVYLEGEGYLYVPESTLPSTFDLSSSFFDELQRLPYWLFKPSLGWIYQFNGWYPYLSIGD